jgi:L-lysine 6-oxidase
MVKRRHDEGFYTEHGLDPVEDETDGEGCEPGDLTKRMAIPWQADFFQCSVQFVNLTDPRVNKDESGIPLPPTYYAYWWPPQSPMYVITGELNASQQQTSGQPAGAQVYYPRGINTFADMIIGWKYLGFVANQNTSQSGRKYPYFVEVERNEEKFVATAVAVGPVSNFANAQDMTFSPMYFLRDEVDRKNIDAHKAIPRTLALRF